MRTRLSVDAIARCRRASRHHIVMNIRGAYAPLIMRRQVTSAQWHRTSARRHHFIYTFYFDKCHTTRVYAPRARMRYACYHAKSVASRRDTLSALMLRFATTEFAMMSRCAPSLLSRCRLRKMLLLRKRCARMIPAWRGALMRRALLLRICAAPRVARYVDAMRCARATLRARGAQQRSRQGAAVAAGVLFFAPRYDAAACLILIYAMQRAAICRHVTRRAISR